MPSLRPIERTTVGNKRLAVVNDLVLLKQYHVQSSRIVNNINELRREITDEMLNSKFLKEVETLKCLQQLMNDIVNSIATNVNCRTVVNTFFSNACANSNSDNITLDQLALVTPN